MARLLAWVHNLLQYKVMETQLQKCNPLPHIFFMLPLYQDTYSYKLHDVQEYGYGLPKSTVRMDFNGRL